MFTRRILALAGVLTLPERQRPRRGLIAADHAAGHRHAKTVPTLSTVNGPGTAAENTSSAAVQDLQNVIRNKVVKARLKWRYRRS